ncbi:MAG: CehA/McbA family metallohydrolase [Candidatus Aminicenantales bacterium]
MRRPKKRFLTAVVFLFCLYAFWLGFMIVRHRIPGESPPPRPSPYFEVQGAYHIHTTHSDGRRPPGKVAAAASRQHLDFIILTDHGNPNRPSLAEEGWKDNILVLAGSELSVSRGHLVALDFAKPGGTFAQNAEEAVQQIAAAGGLSIIAHPYSKTRWSWGGDIHPDGIEIVDSDSMIKKNFLPALPYLPALLFAPRLFLLKTLERPVQTLRKWDELSTARNVYGYFSTDAHLAYGILFSCFRLHVLLEEPLAGAFAEAKDQVFSALRRGRFYGAVDAARPAGGFLFWAEKGNTRFPMGSALSFAAAPRLRLRAVADFPNAEIRLLRNGEIVLRSEAREISFAAQDPGVYRIEIYLRGKTPLAEDFPWIVSNPIFWREDEP